MKKKGIFLGILFIAALVVRIIWAVMAEKIDPFLISNPLLGDAASYYRIAMNLLMGNGFSQYEKIPSSFWPPLYPYSLFLIFKVFGNNITIARIIQAFWGAVPPVVFAWIALKNFGKAEAYLAGIGLLAYPILIYFGAWLIAEALFMMLFSLTLLCAAVFAWKAENKWLMLMGIFLGLAILTKPGALFYAPILAIWVFLAQKSIAISRRIKYTGILTIVTLAIVIPWTIRNYVALGRFTLVASNSGYTLLGANNPNAWGGHDEGFPALISGMNESEMEGVFYSQAIGWIRAHPIDFLRLGITKLQRLISPLSIASIREDFHIPGSVFVYAIYRIFLVTAVIGMAIGLKYFRKIGFLYGPIIGILISAFIYYGDTRYTIPMVPSLVIFSVICLAACFNWLRSHIHPKIKLAY